MDDSTTCKLFPSPAQTFLLNLEVLNTVVAQISIYSAKQSKIAWEVMSFLKELLPSSVLNNQLFSGGCGGSNNSDL